MFLMMGNGVMSFNKKYIEEHGDEFVVSFEGCKKKNRKTDEFYGKVLHSFNVIVKTK